MSHQHSTAYIQYTSNLHTWIFREGNTVVTFDEAPSCASSRHFNQHAVCSRHITPKGFWWSSDAWGMFHSSTPFLLNLPRLPLLHISTPTSRMWKPYLNRFRSHTCYLYLSRWQQQPCQGTKQQQPSSYLRAQGCHGKRKWPHNSDNTLCLVAAGRKLRYISKILTFKTTVLAEPKVAMTFSLMTNL